MGLREVKRKRGSPPYAVALALMSVLLLTLAAAAGGLLLYNWYKAPANMPTPEGTPTAQAGQSTATTLPQEGHMAASKQPPQAAAQNPTTSTLENVILAAATTAPQSPTAYENQPASEIRLAPSTAATGASSAYEGRCTDTDSGLDADVKGIARGEDGLPYDDFCEGDALHEYYCQDGQVLSLRIICGHGCADGRCQQTATPSATTGTVN